MALLRWRDEQAAKPRDERTGRPMSRSEALAQRIQQRHRRGGH